MLGKGGISVLQTSIFIPSQQRWWEEEPCWFWLMGSMSTSTLALCVQDLVGRIQTTVCAQSLSNFTCKLWMMRGGTLLILGHGVKVKVNFNTLLYKTLWAQYRLQFCPITFKLHMQIDFGSQGQRSRSTLALCCIKTLWERYRLQFLPNHFQTWHAGCGWWEEEPYWFWLIGSIVMVNFGTLLVKPCGCNAGYSFCLITSNFICKLLMMRGETLFILGHRVNCHGQLWPPGRGCHALRCLVLYTYLIIIYIHDSGNRHYKHQFLCPRIEWSGRIVFVLSVSLFVCCQL